MKIEIDTEDSAAMDKMRAAVNEYSDRLTGGHTLKKALEQAFQPIPEEPKNLGTIVRDANGIVVIKSWMDGDGPAWSQVTESADTFEWEELAHPVQILSNGRADEVWRDG